MISPIQYNNSRLAIHRLSKKLKQKKTQTMFALWHGKKAEIRFHLLVEALRKQKYMMKKKIKVLSCGCVEDVWSMHLYVILKTYCVRTFERD